MTNNKIINWFIPETITRGQTNLEMARIFVFTHLAGPVIAQPMGIFLYLVSPAVTPQLCSWFWALPVSGSCHSSCVRRGA